jgi:hypothetical protein
MKESTSPFWPRGLLVGALLAAFLIIPAFVVMMFDAAAGTSRSSGEPGRFALFQRPLQLRGSDVFFDGRLAVQAAVLQRFAPLSSGDAEKSAGRPRDLLAGGQPAAQARTTLLRLRLENRSDQNIEVEIVRVDSGLGDFTGRPDRLMLAPNQIASIESPVSGQKVTAHSLPVDVALRLAGNVETRKLVLNDRSLAQAGN